VSIKLPDSIYSGKQGKMHVQGIALDKKNGFMYFSFTDRLIKTDLSGKLIGSVTGFIGHLGDLDFNENDGRVYGSLEYKNDAIGKGIQKTLGVQKKNENAFYVAVFDGSRIERPGMDAEKDGLLQTIYIAEAVKDHEATGYSESGTKRHRFACSGIDGLTFAPNIGGSGSSTQFLYIAYGVYGDIDRQDNDHQVILKYDVSDWSRYSKTLSQDKLHHSGPAKPVEKYFIKTGSTRYGIQNLAYDSHSGNLFAAVYRGAKTSFPNYDLFAINVRQKARKESLALGNEKINVKTLSLLPGGLKDPATGIYGWRFKWGATGLCPLGDGLFYISHNRKDQDGLEDATVYKYRWVGESEKAFVRSTD
jgi:hypothetical protein